MSNPQNILVTCSFIVWLGVILTELIYNKFRKKSLIFAGIQLILIAFTAKFLNAYFGYFTDIETMGGSVISEEWTLVGLYISTVLGMIGHHVFLQVGKLEGKKEVELKETSSIPKNPFSLQWVLTLKPLAVSPIIFISVLSQINKLGGQTNTWESVIMQFLLAFQSGFFWKTIFSQSTTERQK